MMIHHTTVVCLLAFDPEFWGKSFSSIGQCSVKFSDPMKEVVLKLCSLMLTALGVQMLAGGRTVKFYITPSIS